MNKFEYDQAKTELAVLEQDYSDMERIMELKEQITRYENANPSWLSSNEKR